MNLFFLVIFILFFFIIPRILKPYFNYPDKIIYEWLKSDQPQLIHLNTFQKILYFLSYADSYLKLILLSFNLPLILLNYLKWKRIAYNKEFVLQNSQFGICITPIENNQEIINLLHELDVKEVIIRIPCWEKDFKKYTEVISLLKNENININLALLQNREAVKNPIIWEEFLRKIMSSYELNNYQIGIAPNRKKWGIWGYEEYFSLIDVANKLKREFPKIKLIGPAIIDFEWIYLNAILLKRKKSFDIISHLLYVDRRGSPEKGLTPFKIIFLKSIIGDNPFWITEVNWGLKNKGEYAPVGERACVDEEIYANYLVRYYVFCLCSSIVDKIFWHQLIAEGYGLLDSNFKKRPGFFAFKTMVKELQDSKFLKNELDSIYRFLFEKENENILLLWKESGEEKFVLPEKFIKLISRDGEEINTKESEIIIGEKPCYLHLRK